MHSQPANSGRYGRPSRSSRMTETRIVQEYPDLEVSEIGALTTSAKTVPEDTATLGPEVMVY